MSERRKLIAVRLKSGDKKALDEIYQLYHLKVFAFALSYLKQEQDAMDIVQDTFIKLWEGRRSLKSETMLEPFLFNIVKNTVISLFRKRSTEQKYIDYLGTCMQTNSSATEQIVDFELLQEQYEALIPELPTVRQEVFVMSRKKGLSNKEIAKLKGISEKTVENHITKALAFFKDRLDTNHILAGLFFYLFIN